MLQGKWKNKIDISEIFLVMTLKGIKLEICIKCCQFDPVHICCNDRGSCFMLQESTGSYADICHDRNQIISMKV